MRPITLNDFGRFFHTQGERSVHFWEKYVRPNWKLWLGTAALAAVLLMPDEYLDKVGDLTEEGLRKIGRLGGEMLAGALAGVVKGAGDAVKNAVQETGQAVVQTFLTSPAGIVAAALIVFALILVVPTTRRILAKLVRRAFSLRRPMSQNASKKSVESANGKVPKNQADTQGTAGGSKTTETSLE